MITREISFEERLRWQKRPDGRPVMYQTWQHLLFLHWRYDPGFVQSLLPDGLSVDMYEGNAWLGIVPFYMRKIRPTWSPVVPYLSNFLELNVRTYVIDENGTPGVWFFSLAANRLLAVMLGREWFKLPYCMSRMQSKAFPDGSIDYRSYRRSANPDGESRFIYRGTGVPVPAERATLEQFLVERYILFAVTADRGIATGQVHHAPYKIQPVDLREFSTLPLEQDGFESPVGAPENALYCPGVDVEVFPLNR